MFILFLFLVIFSSQYKLNFNVMQAIRYQHGVQEDEVKIYGAGHSFGEGSVELDIYFR